MAVYDGASNLDIYLGDGKGNFAAPSGAEVVPTGALNDIEHAGPAGIASVPASGTGTATITVPLPPGRHAIVAMYGGSGVLPESHSSQIVIHGNGSQ